jgi:hypothetical protein
VDPSYPSFYPVGRPIPAGARTLVPLYQYIEEDTPISWFTSPESMWIFIVQATKLRDNLKRLFHQNAKRVTCLANAATTYMTMSSRYPRATLGTGPVKHEHPSHDIPAEHVRFPISHGKYSCHRHGWGISESTRRQHFIPNGRRCDLEGQ